MTTAPGRRRGRLVVAGSGPVGMVAALLLRDRFAEVVVLEQQSRDALLDPGRGRTFPIVLAPSSTKLLREVGAWAALEPEGSEYFGVTLHKRLLGREIRFDSHRDGIYAYWRNDLVRCLHEQLEAAGITVRFGVRLAALDVAAGTCRTTAGDELGFDLLLGADGANSTTRELLARSVAAEAGGGPWAMPLDGWYAYRLPPLPGLRKRFDGGRRFHALNVFVDNLPAYPADKFRIVTIFMRHPVEELSVFLKHDPDLPPERVRALNEAFFRPIVGPGDELDRAWEAGHAGHFTQVRAPFFQRGRVLLVGDAAHGFEGNGDLVNLGIDSIGDLRELLDRHADVEPALREYDATVGDALRRYAAFALRRSREEVGLEMGLFGVARAFRLVVRHPVFFGMYEDDFDIVRYVRDYERGTRRVRLMALGVPLALLAAAVWLRLS